jgi:hypothetical protein
MRKLKKSLFCIFVCFTTVSAAQMRTTSPKVKQKDLIEVMVNAFNIKVKEKPPGKKRVSFSIIPVSTTSSGGDKIFVSSINAGFILGHEDSTNVSSVFFLPYTDFAENFGFGMKFNLWTPNNTWNLPGEFRIANISLYSYGLGSSTEESDQFKVAYNNVRFYFSGNHKIVGHFFAGLGLNYDRYYKVGVEEAPTVPNDFEKYGIGTGTNSFSTGLSFTALYDNRKNSINPTEGLYSTIIYRVNPSQLTNDNHWSSLYVDVRRYIPLEGNKRRILAIWGSYWGSYGDVPYLNLPGTQLEPGFRSGRGYSPGRFRGKHMFYLEGEYRFDLTNNGLFGGVVFMNFQSLTNETNKFSGINPALGFGGRIKFNKESSTNLTLDLGFGKDSFNVYIGLGEFF